MLVDSKKRELKDEAVLMVAAQETKSKYPAATVFAALVEEMNTHGTSTYRAGNTIFLMHHAKDRIGIFRALNADTARNYLENCYEPTILNIFKAISRNPPQEGMGYKAVKTEKGYRVTLKLGPKREGAK